MKQLFTKSLCLLLILSSAIFTACKEEFSFSSENPEKNQLYTQDFTLNLKSSLASNIILSTGGSSGNKIYLDGTKVSDLGHWMAIDKKYSKYATDTIFAVTNPVNDGLVATWEITDPSVLKITELSKVGNYIIVQALKPGKTTICAKIENLKSAEIETTVTNVWCENMVLLPTEALTENYTIYKEATEKPERGFVKVKVKKSFVPSADEFTPLAGDNSYKVVWSVPEDKKDIVRLTTSGVQNDSCLIEPLKAGIVTVTGKCMLRTVSVLVSVGESLIIRPIDSLVINTGEGNLLTPTTKWRLSTNSNKFVEFSPTAYPSGVMTDYNTGYTWESLNPDIATISVPDPQTGKCSVTALKAGVAIIRVKAGDAIRGYKEKTVEVTIVDEVSKIKIDEAPENSTTSVALVQNIGKKFNYTVLDVAASTKYRSKVKWEIRAGGLTPPDLTKIQVTADGIVTASEITPEASYYELYAYISRQDHDGMPEVRSQACRLQVLKKGENVNLTFVSGSYSNLWDFEYTTLNLETNLNNRTTNYIKIDTKVDAGFIWAKAPRTYTIGTDISAEYIKDTALNIQTVESGTLTIAAGATPNTYNMKIDFVDKTGAKITNGTGGQDITLTEYNIE